jgi:hypothetical protein
MDEIMKIKLEMMRLSWDIEERDIVVRNSKNFIKFLKHNHNLF